MQKALFPGYTVGPDAYDDIVNICSAYGKKAAIIGGRKALAAAEPQIRKAVEGSGIEIIGTFWYGGEASRENMDMLRPQVADADMIFAVGGGKAIDTCKVLAHETNRPFFTFPTIASTCASCTSLGIVYHPDGSLREYSFSKIPPNHIFINTEIIANAPARYLWAGMGDTMAKHYECTISSRNDVPAHSDAMGIALSSMCAAPILRWGKQAMADCEAHKVTPELTEIIEAIIISTGYVSNFVQVDYTTGMAHAMYNGFTILPTTEEYHHLHGEVVSYGILVMLTADKQYAERDRLLAFNRSIGLPTHLADIHARPEDLPAVTEKALAGIDVRVWALPRRPANADRRGDGAWSRSADPARRTVSVRKSQKTPGATGLDRPVAPGVILSFGERNSRLREAAWEIPPAPPREKAPSGAITQIPASPAR